ncbi:MAG: hypothetical protein RH949_07765 [Coleofasciculus sp. A1-SPW-01]|uniref:hypothetical protein n=1 Tax=Coleofasciculus sp. A1-SPW-01 TaxID=3070819 RepID=UPI0032F8ED85
MGLRKLMGLGLVMVLLSACSIFYEDEAATIPPEETVDKTAIENSSTLGNVSENREELTGEMITVDGKVDEVIDSSTFKLEQEEPLLDKQVLVMNANPDTPIIEDNWVRVTGKVSKFVSKEELEKDYDLTWDLDVEQSIEVEYENKPVILAESVELLAVD